MKAAVHVLPCSEVLRAIGEGNSEPFARAAYRTAEALDGPADVVIVAVPAGRGRDFADRLVALDRGLAPRRRPKYLSEPEDADLRELMEGASDLPRRHA